MIKENLRTSQLQNKECSIKNGEEASTVFFKNDSQCQEIPRKVLEMSTVKKGQEHNNQIKYHTRDWDLYWKRIQCSKRSYWLS